ncbi:hypothetical protein HDU97_009754 [Phlyctochytrium planicorne]|nr:hypothetical protein HDU97_009754 [Phlyctochytrium planicorne]
MMILLFRHIHCTRHFSTRVLKGPAAIYADQVSSGLLRSDPHQQNTVKILQDLHDRLITYKPPPIVPIEVGGGAGIAHKIGLEQLDSEVSNIFSIFQPSSWTFNKPPAPPPKFGPKGLYVHGSVGTGKTMTMDLFFHSVDTERKRRVHFHAFMLDVHKKVHALRTQNGAGFDPIPPVAQELANQAWLLCFDELQVTDITDAMLLRRLFHELFIRGVVVFTTSNRHPDELYKNGIQRSSFLPTIELLKSRCQVHSLDSGIDYRVAGRSTLSTFFHPLNAATKSKIDLLWDRLTERHTVAPRKLDFFGRSLTIEQTCGKYARIDFKTICGQPHSAADFLSLAQEFNVLVLTDVPKLSFSLRNEARRFITLIDALYENKIKLIMSAEVGPESLLTGDEPPEAADFAGIDRLLLDDLKLSAKALNSSIFTGAEEVFAFRRAVSRLHEMQTPEWQGPEIARILEAR